MSEPTKPPFDEADILWRRVLPDLSERVLTRNAYGGYDMWSISPGCDWHPYEPSKSDLGACVEQLAAVEKERDELKDALWQHRIDLHMSSSRPCPTCANSARLLGIQGPDAQRCMKPWENEDARKALSPQPLTETESKAAEAGTEKMEGEGEGEGE